MPIDSPAVVTHFIANQAIGLIEWAQVNGRNGLPITQNLELDTKYLVSRSSLLDMKEKIKKIPVVFWALDLWPDTLTAVGAVRSPTVLRMIGRLVQYIYNRCTLVLGQSRGFMGSIANYCNDPTKIRYFPSWAEDVFTNTGVNPAPEIPVLKHGFTVLFAGNIGEAQDMPAVLVS